jgi:hypothetical protein
MSRLCGIAGCERRSETRCGYCLMHYKRWKKHGDAAIVKKQKYIGKCSVPTCANVDVARGLCGKHVQRLYSGSSMDELPSLFDRLGNFEISDSNCWEWTGAYAGNETHKYGQIKIFGMPVPVHRFMYELFVGRVPNFGVVCHRCDNPRCINPEHLFLGTSKDNSEDMVAKGRWRNRPQEATS